MGNNLESGQVVERVLDGAFDQKYFIFLPRNGVRQQRVLVSVHGISRNAEEHLQGFSAQAERFGVAMVAPLFPLQDFPRYQRLGTTSQEGRADLALDQVLREAAGLLGIDPFPLNLFGFSGGGQFAHRYAMLYPDRVRRMVLGAPGWYTFPDAGERYPLGLRASNDWPRLKFVPERFLKIPTCVLVGESDDIRDADLNTTRRVDARQGFDRCERGQRWIESMRSLARAFRVSGEFQFEIIPNASHAFESYMAYPAFAERIFEFLFGPEPD